MNGSRYTRSDDQLRSVMLAMLDQRGSWVRDEWIGHVAEFLDEPVKRVRRMTVAITAAGQAQCYEENGECYIRRS